MADDKTKKGLADRTRINVNEDYELEYWTAALGVTRDALREAVKNAGPSVKAVRDYLTK